MLTIGSESYMWKNQQRKRIRRRRSMQLWFDWSEGDYRIGQKGK